MNRELKNGRYICIKAFDEVFDLDPEVILFHVPDFMGKEQLNIGLKFSSECEDGLTLFAVITKNFNEFIGLKNCAYIDTNNCPFADQLLTLGIAVDTGLTKKSGFCTYPLWQFDESFLKSIASETYESYSRSYDEYMEFMCPAKDSGGDEQ